MAEVRQPNFARLESDAHRPTLELLRRVAEAMGYRLDVYIMPTDDEVSPCADPAQA